MLHASVSKTEGLEKSGRDSTIAFVMAAFRFANVEAKTKFVKGKARSIAFNYLR